MKKRSKNKFNIWTLVLIASVCYFGYTIYQQQVYIEQKQVQINKMKKDMHSETIRQQQLLEQKATINTEEFAEKIAREKLGYVKDGEKLYVDTNK